MSVAEPEEDPIYFGYELGSEMVVIIVGAKRKEFPIHKKLLCSKSAFFEKAFNSSFKEGEEGKMYLPEDCATAFSVFVHWIYRSKLPYSASPHRGEQRISPEWRGADGTQESYLETLLSLYYMAEKLCINELANKIMDMIQDLAAEVHYRCFQEYNPKNTHPLTVYENTREKSPLRKYYICEMVFYHYSDWRNFRSTDHPVIPRGELKGWVLDWAKESPSLFAEFFVEFQRWSKETFPIDPSKRNNKSKKSTKVSYGRCRFHVHSEGELCHLRYVGQQARPGYPYITNDQSSSDSDYDSTSD